MGIELKKVDDKNGKKNVLARPTNTTSDMVSYSIIQTISEEGFGFLFMIF